MIPDDTTLAYSVPEEQREAVLRVLEYERNPSEQNAEYVCEVMAHTVCNPPLA